MASVGIAFLLEYLDNTIKSEQDIEKLLGLPVLGAVSDISDADERRKSSSHSDISNLKKRGEKVES
jgi:hypothetical protein